MHERLDLGLRSDHPEGLIELRFGMQRSSVVIPIGILPDAILQHAGSKIVQTYVGGLGLWLR